MPAIKATIATMIIAAQVVAITIATKTAVIRGAELITATKIIVAPEEEGAMIMAMKITATRAVAEIER